MTTTKDSATVDATIKKNDNDDTTLEIVFTLDGLALTFTRDCVSFDDAFESMKHVKRIIDIIAASPDTPWSDIPF